jgi:hypothetical protein
MTPEPGVSLSDQLRALEDSMGMLRRALDAIVNEDEQRARLSKAAAAWAGQLEQSLHELAELAPQRRGRRLEEIPENFLQEVLRLHREAGMGRPRIVATMGAPEWMVRRVLKEAAGEKTGSRSRGSQR